MYDQAHDQIQNQNQNDKQTQPDIHITSFCPTPAAKNNLILFAV